MNWTALTLVGLGGLTGSIARYWTVQQIYRWSETWPVQRFPWGTLLVNLIGCFVIGLLAGLATRHDWLTTNLRALLFTGLIGGFTTFSAFGLETVQLMVQRLWSIAAIYLVCSLLFGLLAVALGMRLGGGTAAFSAN